jgi:hypothetical protein
MKYFFLLVCFILPISVFAMSCPDNGSVIITGEKIDEVLQSCGNPVSKKEFSREIPVSQKWKYFKPSLSYANANTEVSFYIANDQVSNINLKDNGQVCEAIPDSNNNITTDCNQEEVNVNSSNICGGIISVGDNVAKVLNICGAPIAKKILNARYVPTVELIYKGSRLSPNTLIFENGMLSDWR